MTAPGRNLADDGPIAATLPEDAQAMRQVARDEGIPTVWDRLAAQEPQCGYCALGSQLPHLCHGSVPDRSRLATGRRKASAAPGRT